MLTSQRILDYIKKNGQASGKELGDYLDTISPRAVRKQLKNLLGKGLLSKNGRPPVVYYSLADQKIPSISFHIDKKVLHTIEERYFFISPSGEAKKGWEGFELWCKKTKQDPAKTAIEYIMTLKKYDEFQRGGYIDGMEKMKHTFKTVFLDKLFYLDFYSIERFGKTKLGQMLLYAKQSQDKNLILKIVKEIRQKIYKLASKYKVDGVLFIPPTVRREIQLWLKIPVHTKIFFLLMTRLDLGQPLTKPLDKLKQRGSVVDRLLVWR